MDEFDAVLNLEADLIAEGHARGVEHGRSDGFNEGYAYGKAEGQQLGAELSACDGRTAMLLAVFEQRPLLSSERLLKTLVAVRSLLSRLKIDSEDDTCVELVNEIRAKMRMLDILLRPQRHIGMHTASTLTTTDLAF
mmetsp:Transcript_4545/g.9835  ORF Transcript_4545/g.9835 Transcript_4545/m.9835 type:complete len:137 (-) Transcript_4545:237-647(-)|eukprot:CAMPEP_0183351228 /NCGR_PEP_ID=MMETSP0164_2-20130417/23435_1 /TAXON_ID=221442 /ORGANISM="Coccolithus pelagicus ssp braarudi, Strain PLY182g" /LENGTH=136 /DNA_ID=CAMNT_0025523347 /DNA_START=186 /DNA_END=596 /DNA_ORIENTATION=-